MRFKGGNGMTYIIVWAAALIAFLVVEGVTAQLVTIWFAAGSLVSLILAVLKFPLWVQIAAFVVVSAITLAVTRPLVRKITKVKKEAMNADRCIGEVGIVTERISNLEGTGAVKVGGIVWTARSTDGNDIEKDTKVQIEKIDGVKVIVKEV